MVHFKFVLKDFLTNILGWCKEHATTLLKVALLFVFLYTFYVGAVGLLRTTTHSKNPSVSSDKGYTADYSVDRSYLGCLSEQLKCLYSNVKSGVPSEKLIELCKDENYCAEFHSTTSK